MNCRQIDKQLFEYCSNNLSPESHDEFNDHLRRCDKCQASVDLALMEDEILHEALDLPLLPDDFTLQVMQKVSASATHISAASGQSNNVSMPKKTPRFFLGGTAAAAVILLALFIPGMMDLTSSKSAVNLADNAAPRQLSQSKIEDNGAVPIGNLQKSESEAITDSAGTSAPTDLPGQAVQAPSNDAAQSLAATGSLSVDSDPGIHPAISSFSLPITAGGIKEKQPSRTSSAAQESLLAAKSQEQDKSVASNDLMRLKPDNLPAYCKLDKIIYTSQNEITYQYLIADSQETLSITITPIALDEDEDKSNAADSVPIKIRSISENEPLRESSLADISVTNQTQVVREVNQSKYIVDLTANIPADDLNNIANSIIFKEDVDIEPSNE